MRKLLACGLLSAALLLAQGNPKDDKIYDQVRLKLAGSADVNGGGIDVVVHDGAVILKGRVQHDRQKQKAGQLAKKVKGVTSVDNQLVVEIAGK